MKDWKVVNLDKMQYLDPSSFGDEASHIVQHELIPTALYYLMCVPVGYIGLGGLQARTGSAIGSWCGDRIAIVSNQTQDGDIPGVHGAGSIHSKCVKRSVTSSIFSTERTSTGMKGEFKNVSGWVREDLKANNLYPKKSAVPAVISFNGIEYSPR